MSPISDGVTDDLLAPPADAETPLRRLAEQAITRTGGAPLIAGNAVRVLRDSTEHYPAWLEAITRAKRLILFDNYIIARDEIGRRSCEALAAKAREGVRVRVIYDWLGSRCRAGCSRR